MRSPNNTKVWADPYDVGVLSGNPAGIGAGLALLSLSLPAAVLARRLGWSLRTAVFAPFIYAAVFYGMLNSILATLRQGGIRWRETFYPLAALRAGNVR